MKRFLYPALSALIVWQCASALSFVQCSAAPPRCSTERPDPAPPTPKEKYGCWLPIKETGNYWKAYCYVVGGRMHKHYVIWFPHTPERCYCYNPQKKAYWGHWNGFGKTATFTPAVRKARTVRKTEFSHEEIVAPLAPGGGFPMTPPEDLPPDAMAAP